MTQPCSLKLDSERDESRVSRIVLFSFLSCIFMHWRSWQLHACILVQCVLEDYTKLLTLLVFAQVEIQRACVWNAGGLSCCAWFTLVWYWEACCVWCYVLHCTGSRLKSRSLAFVGCLTRLQERHNLRQSNQVVWRQRARLFLRKHGVQCQKKSTLLSRRVPVVNKVFLARTCASKRSNSCACTMHISVWAGTVFC